MNPRLQGALLVVVTSTVVVNFLLTIHLMVLLNKLSFYLASQFEPTPNSVERIRRQIHVVKGRQ